MIFEKTIATVFGIGYIQKGAGTVAAVAYCLFWFFLPSHSLTIELLSLAAVLVMGVWTGNALEKQWGEDSNRIVIDELAGMMIALLMVPAEIKYVVTALVLFRFFDIAKPLGVKKMEGFRGGWGVMADDVLAGVYALAIIQLIIKMNLL